MAHHRLRGATDSFARILLVLLTAFVHQAAVAATRFVNAATGADAGTCTSAAAPCKTITYAMSQAAAGSPGDLVSVAPGTYNTALGESFPITVKSGVQLVSTTNANDAIIDAANAFKRVLQTAAGSNSSTRIQGFTIRNGSLNNGDYFNPGGGGGIFIDGGSPVIAKNLITGNAVAGYLGTIAPLSSGGHAYGGGIHGVNATPTIANNIISNNTTQGGKGGFGLPGYGSAGPGGNGEGGGLHVSGPGGGAIINNTVYNNSATGGAGGGGTSGGIGRYGGIYANGLEVKNNIIAKNGAMKGAVGSGTAGSASQGGMSYGNPFAGDASNNLFFGNTVDGAASTGDTIGTNSRCYLSPGCASVVFHGEPGDLQVRSASPAASTGVATSVIDDFLGTTRTTPPSIGAFEARDPMLTLINAVAPAQASSGKDIVLTLTLVNISPGTIGGITVSNPIPAGTSYVWTTPNCGFAAATVTCSLGSLAPNAGVRMRLVLRPPAAGTITNTATVTATAHDSSAINNHAVALVPVSASAAGVAVLRYRLYSDVSKEHHFTTDLNEYNTLGTYVGVWVKEGSVGKVLNNPGTFNGVAAIPYYRLYDNQTRWHHWTSDPNEYYLLAEFPWWSAEGVDGYILPTQASGSIPLYRLLYPYIGGLHHWTTDGYEYGVLTSSYGWVGEGGSGFVIP